MKNFFANVWDRLTRVPPAILGAAAAGIAILLLILRGRRLEAELAQAKVREQAAKSRFLAARNWGERAVYERDANQAAAEAKELEDEAKRVEDAGMEELSRIRKLPAHKIHKEYMELARRAKERAREQ